MTIWHAVLRTLVTSFVKNRRVYRAVVDMPNIKTKLKTEGTSKTAGRIVGRAIKRFRDL